MVETLGWHYPSVLALPSFGFVESNLAKLRFRQAQLTDATSRVQVYVACLCEPQSKPG